MKIEKTASNRIFSFFAFRQRLQGACPYDQNCLNNPYGAGSPYKADGLNNPYSQYGSPYSNKSHTNPYATDAPKLTIVKVTTAGGLAITHTIQIQHLILMEGMEAPIPQTASITPMGQGILTQMTQFTLCRRGNALYTSSACSAARNKPTAAHRVRATQKERPRERTE
ncbi:hypothetical protein [Marinobacter sp. Arc7-DN-1]|uniref:hypothetical protein n=1 Tax=Marinobacter sp. Arc7-DN-1 TaxID=2304594 RepID=UPI0019684729|nr:hypothetical protein [Marinobacter sp. Arc7-DN-1]